ncbi:putative nuclease HARBI1 [Heterodontus francisci]|uniref:putative nuclease HARBI1 n=1 Tax=Heterodontus francisci TaxID=7792 RepID=UPI00355BAF7C
MCRISQSAAHLCIREVTHALFRRVGDYVHFRTDVNYLTERSIGSGAIAGFPQMQSVIDCTHVAIKVPAHQPAAFINSKCFHFHNVQLVCNRRKQFLQAVQGARAFLASRAPSEMDPWKQGLSTEDMAFDTCEEPMHRCTEKGCEEPMFSCIEKGYNACHGTTQATIEQTIGLLKMRFRCLDRSGEVLHYALARVSRIMVVCCVLYNLALQSGEALNNEDSEECAVSSADKDAEEEAGSWPSITRCQTPGTTRERP